MKSKPRSNLKEKSTFSSNKMKTSGLACPCIRFILSILKNEIQSKIISTKTDTKTQKKVNAVENPELVKIISTKSDTNTPKKVNAVVKTELVSPLPKTQKTRIIRIPKNGCITSFLTRWFNALSNTESLRMNKVEIAEAINVISSVKNDLDGGRAWSGSIKIAENLHLKLYKTGLVLHHKH